MSLGYRISCSEFATSICAINEDSSLVEYFLTLGEDCAAMTYFHTDNHTWLNDDGCDVESDYMCQLHVTDKGT